MRGYHQEESPDGGNLSSKLNSEQGMRGTLDPTYYLFITLAYAEHHHSMFHMAITPP